MSLQEQWYDFVTQADIDMDNIKSEEEMTERVRLLSEAFRLSADVGE